MTQYTQEQINSVFKAIDSYSSNNLTNLTEILTNLKTLGEIDWDNFRMSSGNYAGWIPLHLAVENRDIKMANILIEFGADVNTKIKGGEIAGRTPLHFAAVVGDVELIALLIEAGADVNARAQGKYFNGITPLHFAVERGVKDAVSLLIEKGADISAKTESANNDLRKTPLDIAIEREREELIGLLKKNSKNGVMKFGNLVSLIKKY